MKKGFNQKEQDYLLANRLEKPSTDLAKHLGCSKSKVLSFFRRKGLKLPKEVREKFRTMKLKGKTTLTEEQSRFIQDNYLQIPIKRMAQMIGRSGTAVRIRMKQLGLKVPKELARQRKQQNQFRKGQISHNKGLKQSDFMSPEAIENSKKTRFSKGRLPHNTCEIGHIRQSKDGYTEIKTENGFRFKHHLVYEEHYGEIPEDHMIVFKDGNKRNFSPGNLQAITKSENLRRNWHDYPAPLKKAIRLTNKIQNEL